MDTRRYTAVIQLIAAERAQEVAHGGGGEIGVQGLSTISPFY